MPKRKKSRRRSPKTTSLYDVAVAYGNMSILTEGALGTSPWGFVTGATDLGMSVVSDRALGVGTMEMTGAGEISLGDLVKEPGLAFSTITSNVASNWLPMTISAVTFNAGAQIFKRAMRKPINTANRVIFRPLRLGVRI